MRILPLALACSLGPSGAIAAEAGLPAPDRIRHECAVNGTAGHPRAACLGARRPGATPRRRQRLGAVAQRACRALETAILESEQVERRTRAAMMEAVQQDLFILRQRYRKLGC